jgi:hypothetical protein
MRDEVVPGGAVGGKIAGGTVRFVKLHAIFGSLIAE